jgi:hypothetical protein
MSIRSYCLAFAAIAIAASGCASQAPRYNTNYGSVTVLKSAGLESVKVGEIAKLPAKAKADDVDRLTIRGGTYNSPYGSFTAFLREALKDELDHADLLNDKSSFQIDGVLLRNVLDGSGFSIGFAEIEAQFVVKRSGSSIYDKTHTARVEWPSSFVGAVAIPRAMQNYQLVVRDLLAKLYADPAFVAALKKR